MLNIIELALLGVFLFFYVGVFYNVPILAAGVRDLRRSRRQKKKAFVSVGALPLFSIVLPVKNERKVIGRILEALSRLDYPVDRFEVVIVADDSLDGTLEICRSFAVSHVNFRVLQRSFSGGKASALNFGVSHCKGDIVAVFDADNVPASDLLSEAAEHFRDSEVAALQGRIHSINSHENMLTKFITYEDAVWCEAFLRGKNSLGLFVQLRGFCQFIRRNVLEGIGGFREGSMAEDVDLSVRLTEKGHKIKYASELRVWQEIPSSLGTFLRQRTRWFRGHMEIALRYGRLLKNVNRRTVDAEFTLFLPFVTIASLFCFSFASWGIFSSAFSFNFVLQACMIFSTFATISMIVLAGSALVLYSKPISLRNLLWLPFVFGYWCLESFIAYYAGLLILLRRPSSWVKTEKSGIVQNPDFASEVVAGMPGLLSALVYKQEGFVVENLDSAGN